MPQDRRAAFRRAVLAGAASLVGADPLEAALLVLQRFPEDHASVVGALGSQPELQYRYLRAALQVGWCAGDAALLSGSMKQRQGSRSSRWRHRCAVLMPALPAPQ